MEPVPTQAAGEPNNHSSKANAMQSSVSPRSAAANRTMTMSSSQGGLMGKHRMAAAISYLNQQIQIIQEELDQLETIGGASTVCQELISSIDSVPDALLPVTRGPAEVGWDRWFQGAQSSKSRRRRI